MIIAMNAAHLLGEDVDYQGQRNHHQRPGHQQEFGVGARIDVVVHVNRQGDEFLPVNHPIAGEDQQKQHEARVGKDRPEIARSLRHARSLNFFRTAGLAEE